jgi:hypothetical protein
MFPAIPIRTCLGRAGWMLLTLSLLVSLVGASLDRLPSSGIELAPPSNVRSWGVLAITSTAMLWTG